ncbi:MAG: hypothetical protein NVSMB9_08620 [Isosphaeraceae bacterium]
MTRKPPSTSEKTLEKPNKSQDAKPSFPNVVPKKRYRVRTPLTAEQQKLARGYMPLAMSLANKVSASWPHEEEEFQSAALMALVQAAQSFDPNRNVKFSTFAHYRIAGAIQDVQRGLILAGLRDEKRYHCPTIRTIGFNNPQRARFLIDVIDVPDPPIGADVDAVDFVESYLRKLPPRNAAVCREIYLNGRNQRETAEKLGSSQARLSVLHRESLDFLKEALARDEQKEALRKERDRVRAELLK